MDSTDLIILLKQRQGPRKQQDLAREIGCSPEHLSQIMTGKRLARGKVLEYLGVRWIEDCYEKRSPNWPLKQRRIS